MLFASKTRLLIITLFFVTASFCKADEIYQLTAEQWAVPRTVNSVLAMPALVSVMGKLQNTSGARLAIRYPGGDKGTLWAHELRAWLISFGLPHEQIELIPGSSNGQVLFLEVLLTSTEESVNNSYK